MRKRDADRSALTCRALVTHTSRMTSPDQYTPPSYKGAILAAIFVIVVIAILVVAFTGIIRF